MVAKGVDVTVTELALVVVAPALHVATVENRTGEVIACADRNRGAACAQVDDGEFVAHLVVIVATADGGVFVAEFAVVSIAPALHVAVVENRARKVVACADRNRGAACAQVDDGQFATHLVVIVAKVVVVTVTELAKKVVAPAFHVTTVENHTRVVIACADRNRGAAQVNDGQVVTHLSVMVAKGVGVTVTELALVVVAPALHVATVENRTRMLVTGADRNRGAACAQVDNGQVVTHLSVIVTKGVGVTVTELALVVVAPTPDVPVCQRTRVVRTCADVGARDARNSRTQHGRPRSVGAGDLNLCGTRRPRSTRISRPRHAHR